ncbi:hypothetical protein G4177_13180 [Corallococcus sp. ZKHCc1 1396]|uniref:RCK C-terminal domain-containing protein n=1 Tax=Corallococcus soli TaxID=2710757 RepID=A0ABR9PMI5_9BACT|nr:hypothetical protein [Corallococcus soli]MBE4749115.1 hypothetical protein [Corallococcus soli]
MPNVFLYNPFKSDCIEDLIDRWVNAEEARGWKKDLVRVRHGPNKPLDDLEPGDTLYIIGHGDVTPNRICDRASSDGGTPEILHPPQLAARLFADGLTDKAITIKIYSCLAARGVLDSFATNAALQIKQKCGSSGGLSCKFNIYGYDEIVSILVLNPQTGEYGKFVGELKEDVTGVGEDTIELTTRKAKSSRKLLVKKGFGLVM